MISKALTIIISQLNQYIPTPAGGSEVVVMGNIALHDSADADGLQERVVVSLVNVEEESTLKNGVNYQKILGKVEYVERPVYLNLYVLFSANFPKNYSRALEALSSVITFFQHRKSFNINSAQPLPDIFDVTNPDGADLHITLELYTMTFEQVNQLWGSLGGKQMPFALYKIRLLKLQDRKVSAEGPLIEEIQNNLKNTPDSC